MTYNISDTRINITHTPSPTAADIDFLTQKINEETLEFGKTYPFGFFARNEEDKIIAGCHGLVIFGKIYTDQLWVHVDYRKRGLARQLMECVHDFGRKQGCTMATLSTMSFQGAKEFYEKLGYVVDFERAGYTHDSSCFFLRKQL